MSILCILRSGGRRGAETAGTKRDTGLEIHWEKRRGQHADRGGGREGEEETLLASPPLTREAPRSRGVVLLEVPDEALGAELGDQGPERAGSLGREPEGVEEEETGPCFLGVPGGGDAERVPVARDPELGAAELEEAPVGDPEGLLEGGAVEEEVVNRLDPA